MSAVVNTTDFTLVDWNEYVNPNYIELILANGRRLQIKPRKTTREKSYQAWFDLLDMCNESGSKGDCAKAVIQDAINKMCSNLK